MARNTAKATRTETNSQTPSLMLAGIDCLIELIQEQAKGLQGQLPAGLPSGEQRGTEAPAIPRPLDDLDLFVARLKQLKEWLQQDPRLLPVVDDYIGGQVYKMEQRQSRRNWWLAVTTTVAGAVLGWAISLLGTPATLVHLLGH
jgi:hypothetical protein